MPRVGARLSPALADRTHLADLGTFPLTSPTSVSDAPRHRCVRLRKGAYLSADGLASDCDVAKIPGLLAERGYAPEAIDLIMGENFLWLFKAATDN